MYGDRKILLHSTCWIFMIKFSFFTDIHRSRVSRKVRLEGLKLFTKVKLIIERLANDAKYFVGLP